ncbi:hypothetical protein, conserved [Leishmania tarentolae]|uniref:Cation efflux protein transmembrane domain-containing protein n=1 Tax=Leishmania tarentolae TaxID=5689 RepID=A0A640KP94_LEITA|nr:hypothetical protein, conserved [Leishmania tarentolae]
MLPEVCMLLFTPSKNRRVRRWQQAAITFSGLWVISVVFIISTSFLVVSVQALVLLNTAASLAAAIVTHSLCSHAGTQRNYPFGFGLHRLSVVVRLGSTIFLVFGCVTTVVESLHHGIHGHHSSPFVPLALGGLQLLAQLVFVRDVCLTDRVTGYSGRAGAHSEDILHTLCASACSDGRGMGGGSFFEDSNHLSKPSTQFQVSAGSKGIYPISSSTAHTMRHSCAQTAVYLLCPITCAVSSVLMVVTHSGLPDVAGALLLAIYYAYAGFRNGRDMLDLLMNKCVTDPQRLRNLERYLRSIKMLDGVLQVQSTVWWKLNASDSMLLIRLRLMSGADGCSISQAVRKQLAELATYVYVECFPAKDMNDIEQSTQLSWSAPLMGPHGHSHGVHGDCHTHHGHSHRGGVGGQEHGHSHGSGQDDDKGHHDHDHNHSHGHLPDGKGELNMAPGRYSNGFGNIDGNPPTGPMSGALPYEAQVYPEAVPGTAGVGSASGALAFPSPPVGKRGECDSSTKRHGFRNSSPPIFSSSSGQPLSMTYCATNKCTTPAPSSPSTDFQHDKYSLYSGDLTNSDSHFFQQAPGGTAASAADSTSFPAVPSFHLPASLPSVFTPFHDGRAHIGTQVRRGAPQFTSYNDV